jgi:hypothetical protein
MPVENENENIPKITIKLIGGKENHYLATEKMAERIALLLNLAQKTGNNRLLAMLKILSEADDLDLKK